MFEEHLISWGAWSGEDKSGNVVEGFKQRWGLVLVGTLACAVISCGKEGL